MQMTPHMELYFLDTFANRNEQIENNIKGEQTLKENKLWPFDRFSASSIGHMVPVKYPKRYCSSKMTRLFYNILIIWLPCCIQNAIALLKWLVYLIMYWSYSSLNVSKPYCHFWRIYKDEKWSKGHCLFPFYLRSSFLLFSIG